MFCKYLEIGKRKILSWWKEKNKHGYVEFYSESDKKLYGIDGMELEVVGNYISDYYELYQEYTMWSQYGT